MDLAYSSGGILPGRGLINPAFVIKIVPATDDMQEQPTNGRKNPNTDFLDNLETGASVEARVGKYVISGRVQRIIKNSLGDSTYVVIRDENGKIHKIVSTLITPTEIDFIPGKERLSSSPAVFNESFMSFSAFLNNK